MFPGFNKAKRGSISNGDWDRDGVKNKGDCEPLNFKKQDGGSNGLTDKRGYYTGYCQCSCKKCMQGDEHCQGLVCRGD